MQQTEPKKQSFSDVIKGETPVLVDFYADWCGPCKMMAPVLKELKKKMGNRLHVIKVDTDRNPRAAIRYQVRGIPTLILFYKGKILWQQSGAMMLPQLKAVMEQKLEQIGK